MNAQEVIAEIPKFTLKEKLEIYETLRRCLDEDQPTETRKGGAANRLRGLIQPPGGIPDDFDWKKMKEEILLEKYS